MSRASTVGGLGICVRDERGALAVCTVFFALFLAACAFAVQATEEAIRHRENLQDAADAAAFMAAVIHAKGMNLIVLIHVVMAALLAILVGLRLVESLGIVAMGICSGLAVPTYGASLAYVPTLAELTSDVHDAAAEVREVVDELLPLLHQAAEGVAEVMPLVASVAVAATVHSDYGVLATAIPARLSLPVEDDDFASLCTKAGDLTGGVVSIPFAIIPPVRSGIDAAVEAIVSAGPGWFCGGGQAKPRLKPDAKAGWVGLPKSEAQVGCESASLSDAGRAQSNDAARERACGLASIELLASVPARDGSERAGEPLCPTDCSHADDARCPPREFADCSPDATQNEVAAEQWGGTRVPSGADSPYVRRAAAARTECAPARAESLPLRGFSWVEQTVTRRYRFDVAERRWVEDIARREEGPSRLQKRADDDATAPCGPQGSVGTGYDFDASAPLCSGQPRCLASPGGAPHDGPCPRAAPAPNEPPELVEEDTQVTALLGCGYREATEDTEVPDVDITSEVGGKEDSVPLRVIASARLGGGDFQVRGLAISQHDGRGAGLATAEAIAPGHRAGNGAAEGLAALASRLAVSQAEHYFDDSKLAHGLGDPRDPATRIAWLWNMGWTARLRPLRRSSDDGAHDADTAGDGQEAAVSAAVEAAKDFACAAIGRECDSALALIDDLLGGS